MSSLYAQYVKEREAIEVLEVEHGYATYIFVDAETVYLRDIFVEKAFRKEAIATQLAVQVADIARKQGIKKMVGSVATNVRGVTTSLKVLLADGFEFSHVAGEMIYFKKEI